MNDKNFLDWIRKQPSGYSGKFSEYLESGEGRCVAAHVNRINRGSGRGIKSSFSAIPLTKVEHDLTHSKGDEALMPKEWFEQKADEYKERWLKQGL